MARVTIYHNPRCSKSRQTLALLQDRGLQVEVVEYLKTPPDKDTLADLVKQLAVQPQDLIRKKDAAALGLGDTVDEEELIEFMVAHPSIIERPIVVSNGKARLGRPPENVLEIL